MNVIFLLGNGFDLNLNLKTSYEDFYSYYQTTQSKSTLIEELKTEISDNIKYWSDLELKLGLYTGKLKSSSDIIEVIDDLTEHLSNYLIEQENSFKESKEMSSRLYNYLISPETFLTPADFALLKPFIDTRNNSRRFIDIISFNYTRIIEKIINRNTFNFKIGTTSNSISVTLRELHHIHGLLDYKMVLGVNDIDQISNKELCSIEVKESLIKPECNKASKTLIEKKCESLINKAHLICLYGLSLGDTDKVWWDLIAKNLERDCYLIIFTKDDRVNSRSLHKTGILEREIKEKFFLKPR